MKLAAFDRFCKRLPGSEYVVQWGGSHVHKVGGKLFALASDWMRGGEDFAYIFKAAPMAFEILLEQGVAARAPYLRRGYWVIVESAALPDADLRGYIADSHRIVAASLTKAARARLGL